MIELHLCFTAVDACFSELCSRKQIARNAAHAQSRRRIQNHQRARRISPLTGKHRADHAGVDFGIAGTQAIKRPALEAKIFRCDLELADFAVPRFGDKCLVGDGHFIQAIRAMHNPRAFCSKQGQSARQRFDGLGVRHADDLPRRVRRIRQRPEQIESRLHAQLASQARHPRRGAMIKRGEHETDSDLVQTLFGNFRRGRDIHAQRGEHIRAATAAAGGAIPVLGDG